MQVIPKASPNQAPASTTPSPRERAIAAFNQTQTSNSQELPVQNANKISPEELSVISPPSEQVVESKEESSSPETQKDMAEAPREATKEQPLSSQYAQLARKEKALRAQAQEIKAQQQALAAREEALKPKPETFDPSKYISKDDLMKDPWSILNKNGLTYDALTQQALNQPTQEQLQLMNELSSLKDELRAIKEEQQGSKKSYEEQQKQSYEQAVNQIRLEAKKLVASDPNFETIKETRSSEDVVELITRTFKEEGYLMTVEDAAKEIEDYLIEEAIKIAKLKKVQQRLKPAPAPELKQEAVASQKQPQAKTLSNNMTASKPLSPRERAIAAFNNKKQA